MAVKHVALRAFGSLATVLALACCVAWTIHPAQTSSLAPSLRPPSFGPVELTMQSKGVSEGALDEGLPTLTDGSIWDKGSPQNEGWSGGDYSSGTGRIKRSQYSWWQRHLKPDKQFASEMTDLQKREPHYDMHGNEVSPVHGTEVGEGNPMSYRGPGFDRMTP
mmetsp:Transcript_45903/g.115093  ORF Transcript_45903/g.115093 Transcript_45903/m.115093 type:complete len:163 (+) Transcript_45903:55-543(+)|eukprot:CAMPEP_0173439048 /NCGR_PEP_ID=MMETSP1357-20121228/20743_1 /TAXON_ID=77926 /ORGANISM="Hemiselmis rufescens, Strain PCC563" /LENGTH=162 /DNA_ID=CAMNT_0014404383 /DNA_START=55 /DNA_END=543 /DNA_ORIENTATION=-